MRTASELDTALLNFVETIEPGTSVKQIPHLILESDLFHFDSWSRTLEGDRRAIKNNLKKLVLQRIAQALTPQNIRGEYGREAIFN